MFSFTRPHKSSYSRPSYAHNAIMAQPIDWAEGLPLKGDTYETHFYKKD